MAEAKKKSGLMGVLIGLIDQLIQFGLNGIIG